MTAHKAAGTPEVEPHVFRNADEIERAIKKLERRLAEVRTFDAQKVVLERTGADDVLESAIRETLREVFGTNSPEFQEHQRLELFAGSMWMGMGQSEVIRARERGKIKVANVLQGLIDRLREKQEEFGGASGPAPEAVLGQLKLHPRIAAVAIGRFKDGHHWDAVFAASKALVNLVKELADRYDLDGADLMRQVFSKKSPVLRFNDLKDQTDSDEQEGMMHLFEGAVLAIRNPGGHSFPEGPPELALEYINLLSLLAHRAEAASK